MASSDEARNDRETDRQTARETAWIGRTYLSTFGWQVLEDLVECSPRLGGSDGEKRAHERVATAFRDAGLRDVQAHKFDIDGWTRGSSRLTLRTDSTTHRVDERDILALPGSPTADRLDGRLVHLGYGLPDDYAEADLEDKIVVVRSDVPEWYDHWMHRREKYGLAIDAGARAFLYANHVRGCLPPTGSLAGGLEVIGEIPALGISRELGERIRRYTESGAKPVEARVNIEADLGPATSRNTHGVLGPDTDREVLIGAHVDGHDISEAATDNGAGVAILCEVARALGEIEDRLKTRVRFVGFGCEEFGLLGSQYWVRDRGVSGLKAVLNLDGIGDGRNLNVHTNHFDDFEAPTRQLAEEFRHPVSAVPGFVAHSDHWPFVWEGVPAAMLAADSGRTGRGYAHTYADTLDKVDIRALRDHAIFATRFALLVADPATRLRHRPRGNIREMLEKRGFRTWLERSGDWPY